MTVRHDVTTAQYSDGTITITLSPTTAVGGWQVMFRMFKNFGGGGEPLGLSPAQASGLLHTNLISKWSASGFVNDQSGITLLDSGTGVWRITLNASEVSGMEAGAYAYQFHRMDSGFHKVLVEGYRNLP